MNDMDRGPLWELFVDGLSDLAMILLDPEGKILGWNVGAANMLGHSATEVIGRNFSCLFTAEDNADGKPVASLRRAVAQGRDVENARRVRHDGTQLEAQGVLIPLYNAGKVLVGFGCLTREAIGLTRTAATFASSPLYNVVSLPGPKKILVVDDNAQILETLERQLTSLGYEVILASSGTEALDILARIADIDLLFTDVVMPGGMNGSELVEEARTIRPRLKVMFTSGYFEAALVRNRTIDAGVRVLSKPYRKQELAKRVSEALSA